MRPFIVAGAFCALIGGLMLFPTQSFAQLESARKACCLEMGGAWQARGSTNNFYCYGLGRGRSDAYYQCVLKKGGGGKK